jgi:ubiquinone/menaquinone biosynthesis C-methylase UbiE
MHDTPYDAWAAYINKILVEKFGERRVVTVLDLACGTGSITLRLANMDYDMIGADLSEDMLAEANRKAFDEGKRILFLRQDMRELDLYGTIDAAVCVCDGMNYLLNDGDLLRVFERVHLFMNPKGIFIFDMNTEYKFKELFGETIFEDRSEGGKSYEWENIYNPQTKINEYHMTFFSDENDDFEPFCEVHKQRAYPPADVRNMLLAAGFSDVSVRDGYSDNSMKENSHRVLFICNR